MDVQQQIIEKIRIADRKGANAIIDAWAQKHGYEQLLIEVLEPMLIVIGDEWCNDESYSLAQAYVAAKVMEDFLIKLSELKPTESQNKPIKRAVVIGNIEEDFHALGRRMIGTFLTIEGWEVHDLGNDVLPATFVDKAIEVGARVIGVSAMMMTTASNIKNLRHEIDSRGLKGKIQLAVGGAVFLVKPGLVGQVGGDGTAKNALEVSQLFTDLWKKSKEMEGVL